ncbi:MAG: cation diffusion facilitator family transporter [Anaerolineales bacterium]|nr:cation diffusion facilitator family transporter [Anaerolineales bacterium]MCX7754122.1 cation diffusion facilitator family transporter [Anaerolineales bacterium]
MHTSSSQRLTLTRFAWLSIAAAVATILLKLAAYLLTGSVGLLSDAAESLVNLVGALVALGMLTIAARPPDAQHAFGHSKAEYFSSAIEGLLILSAAAAIAYTAIERLLNPRPLEQMGIGLLVSTAASLINLVVAQILIKAGRKYESITLEADGKHLMTDVWTSVGVIGGLALVAFTGWTMLDPIVALLVAVNIVWTAIDLLRRSVNGLMDASLPASEQQVIETVMAQYRTRQVEFHALRTRQAASRRFLSVHMLVPGSWTVHDAHHIAEDFERDLRAALGDAIVHTHLEPIEDEISMDDVNEKPGE